MRISILGFGTVGRGVYDMIVKSKDFECVSVLEMKEKCKENYMVWDIKDIVSDSDVDTVVECMGGVHPAFEFACEVLKNKKNFVTSNKALVADKGEELQKLASSNGVAFLFSAACGGAIPVLHNLCLAKKTDSIIGIQGILNGTTNFILSKMEDEKSDYASALKMAQQLGYAEADPTADVSGMDTMRKIILASGVAYSKMPKEGYCLEGIERVPSTLPQEYSLRLVGSCGLNEDGSVFAFVQPTLVKKSSVFASVKSNFNMALYNGENSGCISLGGQGAGRYPTASAVLRDLTSISQGDKAMFDDSICSVRADNTKKEFDYYVVRNTKITKERHSVADMFAKSQEVDFFAAFEE